LKVIAVLSTILGSTSIILVIIINTPSARINIAKDIATFHIKNFLATNELKIFESYSSSVDSSG